MSDLAPFVAAAIRDFVVLNQQEEIKALQTQLERERRQSKMVSITGPRGWPIYAQSQFDEGNFDYSPELWKVEFKQDENSSKTNNYSAETKNYLGSNNKYNNDLPTTTQSCTLAELGDMEVRIGGICKARFTGNGIVEGFVNDIYNNYNPHQKSGTVSIWFGGSSGIWLNITIGKIERDQYASLRDLDLGGENLLNTLLHFWNADSKVYFEEVSFLISYMNGAMEQWGISPEPPEPKSRTHSESTTDATDMNTTTTTSTTRL
jgi:hypothetical protein